VIFTDSGKAMTGAMVKIKKRAPTNRILTLDAGSKNNSFAFALGRVDPDTNCILLEGLGEIVPIRGKEISFPNIYKEIITPIIEDLGVTMIVADRWQSKKLLQDAEADFEIESREYSLKMSDFIQYRDTIFNGSFIMPKPELPFGDIMKDELGRYPERFEDCPVSHFIHQNFTVVETLKTVDKGLNRTDDLFRAVVLMVAFLNDPALREEFSGYTEDDEPMNKRSGLGAVTGSMSEPGASQVPGVGVSSGMSSAMAIGGGGGGTTFGTKR
jgi:hypothetical protein